MSETAVVRQILLRVGARPDCRLWRNNTGQAYAPMTPRGRALLREMAASGDARPIHYGVNGQADISGILAPSGKRLELEVKTIDGRLSSDQLTFGRMITHLGGVYKMVRSEDEAAEVIDAAVKG